MAKQESATVRARVPASSANLGPGYDIFSIALESPKLEVEFASASSGSKKITVKELDGGEHEVLPSQNSAGIALSALAAAQGKPDGYTLRISGKFPPAKGLGRSGAEAVGAIFCANSKFKLGLKGSRLVEMAGRAEPSNHLDNVSAAALGGFNIVTKTAIPANQHITTLPPPRDLGVAILIPNVRKPSTASARQVIPMQIQTAEHVQAASHVARISAAFAKGDVQGILESLPWDAIVESARANAGLYGTGVGSAYLLEEKKLLLEKFHVAETISGAGPSRALWYSISEDNAHKRKDRAGVIQPAIEFVTDRLKSLGHHVDDVFVTKPSSKGAVIISNPRR